MKQAGQFVAGLIILAFMGAVLWQAVSEPSSAPPAETSVPEEALPSAATSTPVAPTEATSSVACPMDAKQCPDGSYVGRVGPDCEFQQCPSVATATSGTTTSEQTVCTTEAKQVEECIALYEPVCGTVDIQCVTEPCEPVKQTFSNGCVACREPNVISYTVGACAQ